MMEVSTKFLEKCERFLLELTENRNKNITLKQYTMVNRKKLFEISDLCSKRKRGLILSKDSLLSIDYMVTPIVRYLNNKGIKTYMSCDGHFNAPMWIAINGFIDMKELDAYVTESITYSYVTNDIGINFTLLKADLNYDSPSKMFKAIAKFAEVLENINYRFVTLDEIDKDNYTSFYSKSDGDA